MIDGKTPEDRLKQARQIYEQTWDHYDRLCWFAEVATDEEYFHGSQWSKDDREYLQRQRRPALVFNIIQSKLMHLAGSHEDNLEEPIAAAVGVEDQMLADVLNHIRDRIWDEIEAADIDAEVFEQGIVTGIGSVAIDAMPSPDSPDELEISIFPLSPYEVLWDPASERRSRKDARYVFWHKWISRAEFREEYPEHAARIDEIWADRFGGYGADSSGWIAVSRRPSQDGRDRRGTLYYDRHRDQVRIIRMEYRKARKIIHAVDPVSGHTREVTSAQLAVMQQLAPELESLSHWIQETRWLEFVGDQVLYDDPTPIPIDGFSIVSNICHLDQNNMPYGKVRMLRDPQSEVNKRLSQTLHLLVQQTQPGVFAEEGAFANQRQAEESLKMAGSVTVVTAGAIAGSKFKERTVPQLPDAPLQIHQQAIRLIDLISGIYTDSLMEPRGVPEAAATAQLKHRQSLLSMRPVMRGFNSYQRQLFRKLISLIVRAMTDAQIASLLGNSKRYRIEGHVIVDLETGKQASLESMREVRYKIEVRPADENSSTRILELQTLMGLLSAQMPVDPDVIIDYLSLPSDRKDQLRRYVAQQAKGQAAAAEQQIKTSEAQLAHQAQLDVTDRQLEAAGLAERQRHNMALEEAKQGQLEGNIASLLSDQSAEEQRMVLDLVKTILQHHATTSRPPAQGAP